MSDRQPKRKHVNRSEISKRKSDGKWLRWEYFFESLAHIRACMEANADAPR